MRYDLRIILESLLLASAEHREIQLDAIGEAVGARAVTAPEIDSLVTALEAEGRTIVSPGGGSGEDHLKKVLATARRLHTQLGRTATASEIAVHSDLPEAAVRHALALAKVLQR